MTTTIYTPCKFLTKATKLGIESKFINHSVKLESVKSSINIQKEEDLKRIFKILSIDYKQILSVKETINFLDYGLKTKELTYDKRKLNEKVFFIKKENYEN